MSQPISSLTGYSTSDYNADQNIRNILEMHIHYIRHHESTYLHTVDQGAAMPYFYNLYAYLHHIGLNSKLLWVIMQINDLKGMEDFNRTTTSLLIPDLGLIEEIIAMGKG